MPWTRVEQILRRKILLILLIAAQGQKGGRGSIFRVRNGYVIAEVA
jgi:hypothetical protein